MDFLISVIAFIFVLGVLVFVHEAGHFMLARLVGAPVEVFSLGFGKRLWGFKRGDTDYRISLIPLGGYVRVPGLGPDEMAAVGEETDEAMDLLPRFKRAAILVAGPLTNVVFAIVFMGFAFMLGVEVPAYLDQPPVVGWIEPESPAAAVDIEAGDLVTQVDATSISSWRDLEMALGTSGGHPVEVTLKRQGNQHRVELTPQRTGRYHYGYSGLVPPIAPTIGRVEAGNPAGAAGLQVGDRIAAVNSDPVNHFYDLTTLISPHPNTPITLQVERSGETLEVNLTPTEVGDSGYIGVGMQLAMAIKQYPPGAAMKAGSRETWRLTVETFRILRKLVTFKAPMRQISGPIEIARISGAAARSGYRKLIWFMALISLQLGIFNLLPIPLLDGGHLAIIGFEASIRRDLSLRLKERILQVGFYAIILLFVVVTFNDIAKIIPQQLYDFFARG